MICDDRFAGCVPKARFSAIVPSSDAALISVRLRPGLSESERREAISLFREAVADPSFRLEKGRSGTQPSYVVSGVPVVFEGLAQELSTQIFVLLAAALAAMVITLARRLPDAAAGSCRWGSRWARRASCSASCRWSAAR